MAGFGGSQASFDYTLVGGTWSFDGDEHDRNQWWHPGSPFARFLEARGIRSARRNPFIWSSDIDGGFRWPFGERRYRDWSSAGYALGFYLEEVPAARRLVIAHSHGGAVALFAAASGTRIERLVTISTPVRRDKRIKEVIAAARPNIGRWLHVSVRADRMQRLGELFDGAFGWKRTFDLADWNEKVENKAIGHSGLIRDPLWFTLWEPWLVFLREPDAAVDAWLVARRTE